MMIVAILVYGFYAFWPVALDDEWQALSHVEHNPSFKMLMNQTSDTNFLPQNLSYIESTTQSVNNAFPNPLYEFMHFTRNFSPITLLEHHEWHNPTEKSQLILIAIQSLYTIGFLLLVGSVIWWRIIQNYSFYVRKTYLQWGFVFQCFHFLALISLILMEMNILTDGFIPSLLNQSSIQYGWYLSLMISVLGLLFLYKNRWFDLLFVLILIGCKIEYPADFRSLILALFEILHLIAAAIWFTGLAIVIFFYSKYKTMVKNFIAIFIEYAFVCIVMLVISGSLLAYKYDSPLDLLLKPLGLLLLLKIVLVGFVTIISQKIHSTMDDFHIKCWMYVQLVLMVMIIILVSVISIF
ncbi:hypothetical protein [Ureibacillus thermosphaericus]|nr:hypothetical protein [Ureibacillus thermosphaericus]